MQFTDAFFHGHDHIVTGADGMCTPYRFSPARLAFYADEDEIFAPRAQNSSGISIEFTTSADMFSFDLHITNEVRNENSITVYEDGALVQIIGVTRDEPKTKVIYRKKNEHKMGKPCHYAFYLPTMATASVQNLSAEDAVPQPKRAKQLLALGDSITQGVYAQASAHAYATRLARKFEMELCNHAVGGYYFNQELLGAEAQPDVITVAYGINDISKFGDATLILSLAEDFFAKLVAVYPNIPVFCITPLWRANFLPEQLPIYNVVTQGLLALCEKYQLHAMNGCDVFPHDATLFTDGFLHPNDDGFAIIAEAFAAELQRAGVV